MVLAGQSHISSGITVLVHTSDTQAAQTAHALYLVFHDPHRRLEIERLVRRQVVEQHLLDRRLARSVLVSSPPLNL